MKRFAAFLTVSLILAVSSCAIAADTAEQAFLGKKWAGKGQDC